MRRKTLSIVALAFVLDGCGLYLSDYERGHPNGTDGAAGSHSGVLLRDAGGADGSGPESGAGGHPAPPVPEQGACSGDAECRTTNSCEIARCVDGKCASAFADAGATCGDAGARSCDGTGTCVDRCRDGMLDGEETDLDCGGPACSPCGTGRRCRLAGDCLAKLCAIEQSSPPVLRCSDACVDDGERNGGEAGIDCGQACKRRCALGSSCMADGDCTSNHCVDGTCCGTPCSGPCDRCEPATGACVALAAKERAPRCPDKDDTCTADGGCASCANGVFDGELGETGVDCGGPTCPRCGVGISCNDGSDCTTCICEASVCKQKRCSDHLKNGCESDVDCGGVCGFCGIGRACLSKSDCGSASCSGARCVQP